MTQITENIFVGNSQDQGNGCTGVLNVAVDLDRHIPDVEYHKVGLIDGAGNTSGAITATVLMLQQLLLRHQKVLVHCHAGQSRSPTVVALYLASVRKIEFEKALSFVKSHRTEAGPKEDLLADAEEALPMIRLFLR